MIISPHSSRSYAPKLDYQLYDGSIYYTCTRPDLRLLCGQWLTWQRLQRGLTNSTIARQAGLLASSLHLLQVGRAKASTISLTACNRLGEVLSDTQYSVAWIAAVVAAACGHVDELDESILRQIRSDLMSSLTIR
jgi:hypothetical protein